MSRIKGSRGHSPPIMGKGHAHVVSRDLDYEVEIQWGLIEYEEEQMAKQLPVGGHVEVLPFIYDRSTEWVPAEVIDLLDTQFTCEIPEVGLQFFAYADKGVTWRQLKEE